jgi:hypothetical protein
VSGFGNVLTQAWVVHDFDQRWAVALGGQLIAPTSTNSVASDAWEQVTGFVVRAMLPEISPGSCFAPQVRYGIDFEGNDDGQMLRQLRIAPDPEHQPTASTVSHIVPEPGHSAELWDAGVEPNGSVVSAPQFFNRLEAERSQWSRTSLAFRLSRIFLCTRLRRGSGSATYSDLDADVALTLRMYH